MMKMNGKSVLATQKLIIFFFFEFFAPLEKWESFIEIIIMLFLLI